MVTVYRERGGLRIPLRELLDIDRDTELDMRTDGEKLVLVPIRKARKRRLKEAMDDVMARHGETFRKLAR